VEQPLISCIVPVFNGECYLRESLDSILSQKYRPLEIIVFDDGSTDRSPQIVEGFGKQVRYLRQDNGGPAAARNSGLRIARGDFIAFLDADDLWHPEKLARQMTCLEEQPELDLCITHLQNFWISELKAEAEHFSNHRLSKPMPGYFMLQTLLVRRHVFDAIGLFNTELQVCEDVEWFLRAVERSMIILVLHDILLYRRLHTSNISRMPATQNVLLGIVKASSSRSHRVRDALFQAVKASCCRLRRQDDGMSEFAEFLTAYRRE
jgi:glycosyltransferase involved in cell wall biosynthesis